MANYGALNFKMSDLYGGIYGTTEQTIPDAEDQKALVDDQKAVAEVSNTGKKKKPIFIFAILIIAIIVLFGAVK